MPARHTPALPVLRLRGRIAALCCALLAIHGCSTYRAPERVPPRDFGSTYAKHLARAEQGDPESQNVVAFMLYHGEGVMRDPDAARGWFEQAARAGHRAAMRSLEAMTAPPLATRVRRAGTGALSDALAAGEQLFAKYCGGCHGFNGIAHYEHAPSFALGERLDKPDVDLLRSVRQGHAGMPSWEDKLPPHEIALILAAVRTLPARYAAGTEASMSAAPGYYYVFGPMESPLQSTGR